MTSLLLFPLVAILTLMTGWLAFLLLLAGLSRLVFTEKASPRPLSTTPPFLAVLIPAHEEAQLDKHYGPVHSRVQVSSRSILCHCCGRQLH